MFDAKRLWTAAIACSLFPSVSWASFTVSPMELFLDADPGSYSSAQVTLRNTGDRPLTLKFYLGDNWILPDGKEQNTPPGTHPRSCAPWITLGDQPIELAPGEVHRAEVALEIPGETGGTYWTKLYVEEISAPAPTTQKLGERTIQIYVRQRVGVRLFQNVATSDPPSALITTVSHHTREGQGDGMLVTVENPGTQLLRCNGNVQLRDTEGVVLDTLHLGSEGEFWVYPGGAREVFAPFGADLPPGTYTALAVVDFGGDYLVAGDAVLVVSEDGYAFGVGGSGE